jgi:hypothetical protein
MPVARFSARARIGFFMTPDCAAIDRLGYLEGNN